MTRPVREQLTASPPDPDAIYQALVEAHRDLTPAQSRALDVRICLLLADHVGDPAVIAAAAGEARRSVLADGESTGMAERAR